MTARKAGENPRTWLVQKDGRQRRGFMLSSEMAVIATVAYLFISFMVYTAAAEKTQTGKNCYILQLP